MKTQWTWWQILLKHAPDRKLSALTVDTLDMDSCDTAINIRLIISLLSFYFKYLDYLLIRGLRHQRPLIVPSIAARPFINASNFGGAAMNISDIAP